MVIPRVVEKAGEKTRFTSLAPGKVAFLLFPLFSVTCQCRRVFSTSPSFIKNDVASIGNTLCLLMRDRLFLIHSMILVNF